MSVLCLEIGGGREDDYTRVLPIWDLGARQEGPACQFLTYYPRDEGEPPGPGLLGYLAWNFLTRVLA